MNAIAILTTPSVLYAVLAGLTLWAARRRLHNLAWAMVLSIPLGWGSSQLVKMIVQRPRPDTALPLITAEGYAYPSSHMTAATIDERGVQHEATLAKLRSNANLFNEVATNYASHKNLVIAENEHAMAFAGFGHRFPTVEIYSKSEQPDPWQQTPEEVRSMSDMIQAMHAATGTEVPCNEEWHYRPIDVDLAMPWRVMLKWRVSTLAGFEGATKIYLNTIEPVMLRDRVVDRLFALRNDRKVADSLKIAFEAPCRPNSLRYARPLRG